MGNVFCINFESLNTSGSGLRLEVKLWLFFFSFQKLICCFSNTQTLAIDYKSCQCLPTSAALLVWFCLWFSLQLPWGDVKVPIIYLYMHVLHYFVLGVSSLAIVQCLLSLKMSINTNSSIYFKPCMISFHSAMCRCLVLTSFAITIKWNITTKATITIRQRSKQATMLGSFASKAYWIKKNKTNQWIKERMVIL